VKAEQARFGCSLRARSFPKAGCAGVAAKTVAAHGPAPGRCPGGPDPGGAGHSELAPKLPPWAKAQPNARELGGQWLEAFAPQRAQNRAGSGAPVHRPVRAKEPRATTGILTRNLKNLLCKTHCPSPALSQKPPQRRRAPSQRRGMCFGRDLPPASADAAQTRRALSTAWILPRGRLVRAFVHGGCLRQKAAGRGRFFRHFPEWPSTPLGASGRASGWGAKRAFYKRKPASPPKRFPGRPHPPSGQTGQTGGIFSPPACRIGPKRVVKTYENVSPAQGPGDAGRKRSQGNLSGQQAVTGL